MHAGEMPNVSLRNSLLMTLWGSSLDCRAYARVLGTPDATALWKVHPS